MLDKEILDQIRAHIGKISLPIVLVASLAEDEKSTDLRELLAQIATLSGHITLNTAGTSDRSPSFVVQREDSDVAVEFAGIPLGHELTSLVLALLQVGGHPPSISVELTDAIQALPGPMNFETFMSLSCQNCPDVVQALNTISILNPKIKHIAIDGALYPDEVESRQVLAVPTVFRDNVLFDQGRLTLEQIVGKLDSNSAAKDVARLNAKDSFDLLVVGGGPAGAAAAIYAARKGIRTGVVTERFGGQVLDTVGIENFVSASYTEGPKLVSALEQHVRDYDIDVMDLQQATGLRMAQDGTIAVDLANGGALNTKTAVLATGARWRQMNIPGEFEYRNKGVTYCPHCDGPLFKGKRVAVVGGGNSGVEAAIDLAGVVAHVTLIELLDELRADDILQRKLRSLPNVDILLNAATTEVSGDGQRVTALAYEDRDTGRSKALELDGIFVQIGLLPNTEWLGDAIELTPGGEAVIDNHGRTSMPGIFAGGDCTDTPFKQIVVSLGGGATAALSGRDAIGLTPREPQSTAVSGCIGRTPTLRPSRPGMWGQPAHSFCSDEETGG
jgi:alkyl hydroperoxide reductase subunit F